MSEWPNNPPPPGTPPPPPGGGGPWQQPGGAQPQPGGRQQTPPQAAGQNEWPPGPSGWDNPGALTTSDGWAPVSPGIPGGSGWDNYPTRRLQPVSGLFWAVVVAGAALVLVQLASAALAPSATRQYLQALAAGGSLNDVLTGYDLVGALWIPVALPAWVLTALFLQRARANTLVMNPNAGHARSVVWVWLGWLVPIVSYWFPFQVVRDIVVNSGRGRRDSLVPWWWALWLSLGMLITIGTWITSPLTGKSAAHIVAALPYVEAVTAVIAVAAFAAWVLVVRRITDAQRLS